MGKAQGQVVFIGQHDGSPDQMHVNSRTN